MQLLEHPAIPSRSSKVWSWVFTVGMILNVVLPLVGNPAELGIPPMAWKWLLILNAAIMALAAKIGWSWGSSPKE